MNKKKKTLIWSLVGLVVVLSIAQLWWPTPQSHLREGDIVFRGTNPTVAGLTLSKWTHCGILVKENGKWMVYEAIGLFKKTPLREWKRHDKPCFFRVMRPKQPLTSAQLQQIRRRCAGLSGRRYDHAYRWSDDKQYCSELVWKAYHAAGIDLSTPRKASTFLSFKLLPDKTINRIVKKKGISLDEPMVSPSGLINSKYLKRVW